MKPPSKSTSASALKNPRLRSALFYIIAGLLLLVSYQFGARLGERPPRPEADALRPEKTPSNAALASQQTTTRWQHLNAAIATGIDFRKLCQLAVQVESIDTGPASALSYLVEHLTIEQAESLLLDIDYSTDRETRKNAIDLLQNRLAKLNPGRAIQVAMELPASALQTDLFICGFRELSRIDPDSAYGRAQSLEDPTFLFFAKQEFFSVLAEREPKRAFEWAYSEKINIPSDTLDALCQRWVEQDTDGAREALLDFDTNYVWPARLDLFKAVCQKLIVTSPERVVAIWEKLLGHDYSVASSYMANEMLKAWAAVDPRAALEFALNHPQARAHGNAKGTALTAWLSTEPEAALNWLHAMEDRGLQAEMINGLRAQTLKTLSVDAIIQVVGRVPPRQRDQSLWRSAFAALKAKDYPALMNWINQEPDNRSRSWALNLYYDYEGALDPTKMDVIVSTFVDRSSAWFPRKLTEKWIRRNSSEAWAWIETQAGTGIHEDLVRLYTKQLASRNPASAMAAIRDIETPHLRRSQTNALVREWMKGSPDRALGWIQQSLSGEERKVALATYLRYFNSGNPEDAFTALRELDETQVKELSYSSILGKISTDQAIALVRNLPDEAKPTSTLLRVVASRDPQRAVQLLSDPQLTGPDHDRVELQSIIAREWAESGSKAAVEWARALPMVGGENKPLNEALQWIARYQQNGAYAKDVIETIHEASARNSAILEIHKYLINKDPIGTYDWIKTQGDEITLQTVVRQVTGQLLSRDSIQASAWVEGLPAGPERDAGALEVIDSLMKTSPEEAFPWALSLKDERRSRQELRRLVNEWRRVAPEEAYRAIKYERELSEAEKQSLLEGFQ